MTARIRPCGGWTALTARRTARRNSALLIAPRPFWAVRAVRAVETPSSLWAWLGPCISSLFYFVLGITEGNNRPNRPTAQNRPFRPRQGRFSSGGRKKPTALTARRTARTGATARRKRSDQNDERISKRRPGEASGLFQTYRRRVRSSARAGK